jgi:selT/selW/selH-like putative selenoprotein
LRQYLLQKYPQLDPESIEGENYPPPEPAASIAMLTQTLQLLSMPLLFFGDSIFGGEPPNWYRIMLENKMAIFFGLYMLNVFAQNAAQTGAFEIVHNGKVVFSKLEQQRLPNIQEIDVGLKRTGLIA